MEGLDRVQETLENLDAAEDLVVKVVEKTHETVNYLKSLGKGQRVDTDLLGEHSDEIIRYLSEVHDRMAKEIPELNKYIPFERSSYGAQRDAQVAAQKLEFAREFLKAELKAGRSNTASISASIDGPQHPENSF